MAKHLHEFRDPVHVFVVADTDERRSIDSIAFQRLRNIHQLATSYLIYPGATHKRFEHSLGVMHLSGLVFDIVTNVNLRHNGLRDIFPGDHQIDYWRRVVRVAALCHDVGHLPFSHAAEDELLPKGWDHERLTYEILTSNEFTSMLNSLTPPLRPLDIAKVAIGPKKMSKFSKENFSLWDTVLSEIIVGDAFGVDRMDYLLRDAYHAGVAYGRFDYQRLIQTLRILPKGESGEPWLGVEAGGIEAAEAMSLARYFMYKQIYFHHVRRAYDIHLKDFLKEYLDQGQFSVRTEDHLKTNDNRILADLVESAADPNRVGHLHADRLINRKHFKKIYERNPSDQQINQQSVKAVETSLIQRFGRDQIRRDSYNPQAGSLDFPILTADGRIESSIELSETLRKIPPAVFDIIVCDRAVWPEATRFLAENRQLIVSARE